MEVRKTNNLFFMKAELKFLRYKDIEIDPINKSVFLCSRAIYFPRLEYFLLLFLLKNAEQVIGRLDLLEAVWGYGNPCVQTNTVDAHIYRIRKKLKTNSQVRLITVPRVGFALR